MQMWQINQAKGKPALNADKCENYKQISMEIYLEILLQSILWRIKSVAFAILSSFCNRVEYIDYHRRD